MRAILALSVLAVAACSDAPQEAPAGDARAAEEGASQPEATGAEVATFGNGVKTLESDADVATSVERLEAALEEGGFTVVAKLDHAENAAGVDLEMQPAVSIFFGKAEVGTYLMQAAPVAALDLPQRMAIYEDGDGRTMIAYNSSVWLATRHGIEGEDERLEAVDKALSGLAMAAAGQADAAVNDDENGPGDAPMIMEEEANN